MGDPFADLLNGSRYSNRKPKCQHESRVVTVGGKSVKLSPRMVEVLDLFHQKKSVMTGMYRMCDYAGRTHTLKALFRRGLIREHPDRVWSHAFVSHPYFCLTEAGLDLLGPREPRNAWERLLMDDETGLFDPLVA